MGKTISVHFDYPVDGLGEEFGLVIDEKALVRLREEAGYISGYLWEAADDFLRQILRRDFGARRG